MPWIKRLAKYVSDTLGRLGIEKTAEEISEWLGWKVFVGVGAVLIGLIQEVPLVIVIPAALATVVYLRMLFFERREPPNPRLTTISALRGAAGPDGVETGHARFRFSVVSGSHPYYAIEQQRGDAAYCVIRCKIENATGKTMREVVARISDRSTVRRGNLALAYTKQSSPRQIKLSNERLNLHPEQSCEFTLVACEQGQRPMVCVGDPEFVGSDDFMMAGGYHLARVEVMAEDIPREVFLVELFSGRCGDLFVASISTEQEANPPSA